MEFRELNTATYVLPGAVNMGLVATSDGLVAIDTGLDKQAGKRMVRAADELEKPITAIVNTHAHADHFGGNTTILAKFPDANVFAPIDEAAVIRQPLFEPQYLWQGAMPFSALQNKFLLASPSRVDVEFQPDEVLQIGATTFQSIPFPGHAHGQCGILVNGVLYAADSYFGSAVTDKHGIPFLVDYEKTLTSARAVTSVEANWWVPGHGDPSQNPTDDIDHLCLRHETVYDKVIDAVATEVKSGLSIDELTARLCREFRLLPSNPGSWLLIRTSIAAYVSKAVDAGSLEPRVEGLILRLFPSKR